MMSKSTSVGLCPVSGEVGFTDIGFASLAALEKTTNLAHRCIIHNGLEVAV
jgi:hypothetical protein